MHASISYILLHKLNDVIISLFHALFWTASVMFVMTKYFPQQFTSDTCNLSIKPIDTSHKTKNNNTNFNWLVYLQSIIKRLSISPANANHAYACPIWLQDTAVTCFMLEPWHCSWTHHSSQLLAHLMWILTYCLYQPSFTPNYICPMSSKSHPGADRRVWRWILRQ